MTTSPLLRALPGINAAINADLPKVGQAVENDDFNVTLDVSAQVDLPGLFRAIAKDWHLRDGLRILQHNTANLDLQLSVVRDFLKVPAIRQALTITLGPSQAEDLSGALDDASREPLRCEHWDGRCNNLVEADPNGHNEVHGRRLCPVHLADVEEHGVPWDRGSASYDDASDRR